MGLSRTVAAVFVVFISVGVCLFSFSAKDRRLSIDALVQIGAENLNFSNVPVVLHLENVIEEARTQVGIDCNAAESHIVAVALELAAVLGFHIARSEDIYRHYPAMTLFLEGLRRLRVAYPTYEGCWHHWWFTFQNRVRDTIISRVNHFGGPKTVGQLYIAAGFGEYVTRHSTGRHPRHGFFPQDLVTHVAKKECVNFTMYFVNYFDEDVYILTSTDIQQRTLLRNFLIDFPNFFILHYSPSMVMPNGQGSSFLGERDPFYPDRGAKNLLYTMFPRMIPIPHFPENVGTLNRIMSQSWPPKPYSSRIRQVVWRGSTTGHERPYSRSDRSRVVAQFADRGNAKFPWADVAFSTTCQGVSQHELPRFGNRMDADQLMHYQVHLDIDGNTNSWDGLRWRLMFGMVVVKARSSNGFIQWYYRHLRNGENIVEVPITDIGATAHAILDDPDQAAKIGAEAKAFADKYLSFPQMEHAVAEAVRDAWRLGNDDQTKWCISPC